MPDKLNLDDDSIERLVKKLGEKSLNINGKDLEDFGKAFANLNKDLKKNTVTYGGLAAQMLGVNKRYKDLTYTLEQLQEQIEEVSELEGEEAAEKAKQLIAMRNAIQAQDDENKKRTAVVASLTAFTKTMSGGVGVVAKSIGSLATKLQDGGDAFSVANTVLNGGIQLANTGVQAAAGAFSAAGQVVSNSTNPKLRAMGAVAGVVGPLLGKMGDAAAATATFLNDFLTKEAQKLFEAFNKTSASGALFADGLTGMKNTAHEAGLSVKQFSEVVSRNSESLAASGLGVTEGAKTLGRVATDLKKSGVQQQLMQLGYSVEEQADLIAQTTANMRRSAGGKSSDQEIAQQTKAYAENLRTIASITGEDAKKKVAQAHEQNQILAFQQKLAGKSAAQRAQIDAALATMTEQEKKNFRDRIVLGTVINQEGAVYEATVAGAREKSEEAVALFNNNNLTADANAKLNEKYGEQIKNSVMSNQALGTAAYAAGGALTEVAKAQLDALNQANTYTKEAIENTKKNIEGQEKANDELTQNFIKAAQGAQAMSVKLEDIAQNQLKRFSEVVDNVISTVNKQLGIKESGGGATEENSWLGKKMSGAVDWLTQPGHISGVLKTAGVATEFAGLAADSTGVGAVAGVPLNILGGVLGGLGVLADAVGFAGGGVSEGPDTGYLAKLHGTEAVIPLPDGKTVPVQISMPEVNDPATSEDLTSVLKRLADALEGKSTGTGGAANSGDMIASAFNGLQDMLAQQLNLNSDMVSHARDSKDLMQKLVNASM
jgi:hypothetical protein